MWVKINDNMYINDITMETCNIQKLENDKAHYQNLLKDLDFNEIPIPNDIDERVVEIINEKNSQIQGEKLYIEKRLLELDNKLKEIYGS